MGLGVRTRSRQIWAKAERREKGTIRETTIKIFKWGGIMGKNQHLKRLKIT